VQASAEGLTMWMLRNRTAYAAERSWIRDKQGAHRWIVAVKATFELNENGRVSLADQQTPPLRLPEYHGDIGTSSLRYEAELTPDKPTTDVLLLASAYAPKGKPTHEMKVALRVGSIDKSLIVYGPRFYQRRLLDIGLTDADKFVKQPIRYEWAYGGADLAADAPSGQRICKSNPVGKGVAVQLSRLVDREGHRIEYPHTDPAEVGPAGFGPIASYWSPRLELAGTYDACWERTRRPLLPVDYDERHVLCAPVDQQTKAPLCGGETIELIGMTESGVFRFDLPHIRLAFVTKIGSRRDEHPARCSMIIVEPDQFLLKMIWQTSLSVSPNDIDYLDETIITEVH
jgi:hypothetical protein